MEFIFVLGGLAIVVIVIRYPKDTLNVILGIVLLPFRRLWRILSFFLYPLFLVVVWLEKQIGLSIFSKIDTNKSVAGRKTQRRKNIVFHSFDKYLLLNSPNVDVEVQLMEAANTDKQSNFGKWTIHRTKDYTIIELTDISFYAFNFLIQWLDEAFKNVETVGFCINEKLSFTLINDQEGENNMLGVTNGGTTFWVSLYDDLDKMQFLRIDPNILKKSVFATNKVEKLIAHL